MMSLKEETGDDYNVSIMELKLCTIIKYLPIF
ncbi:translocase [Synechococcus sp. WH 5701]|nr:translocase [Synechococcus sp. WH 5701]